MKKFCAAIGCVVCLLAKEWLPLDMSSLDASNFCDVKSEPDGEFRIDI